MKSKLFFFCFLFLTLPLAAQESFALLDSIREYNKSFNDNSLSAKERLNFAKKASELSKRSNIDSLILRSNRNLSYAHLINGDYVKFKDQTTNNLKLARKIIDSSAIAFSAQNLGWYYYQIGGDNTTAYAYLVEALRYFDNLGNLQKKAEVLYAIAAIQNQEKDYLGSEQNAVEALKIFNKLNNIDKALDRYLVLSLLGSLSYKLENYDKSIDYHNQAIELTRKIDGGNDLLLDSQNDLALPYRAKGDYDKALEIYEDLANNENLKKNDLVFHALILDNYAFTKFLSGNYNYSTLEKDFKSALKIADSLGDPYTKLAVSIDLAKFYKANNRLDSSLIYSKQSYKISKDISINDLYLESMLLLATLTKGEESKNYLEEHIKLTDSLLKEERNVRNKYARIEFETDQLEAENEQISKENLYLVFLSIGLLLTAVLVFIVISQRAKNRKLKLIQVQQKANEDIYNLMLGQQDKVDEARTQEKKRISEELHDGVLGRLFGTRLSLDSINFKDGKEAMMTRANYIGQLKSIEEDIRKISHELNTDFVSGTGFMDIVSELIENQTQAYGLTYDFDYTDDISWDSVSNKTKINIYRIIQESMQNIYKHANAKAIKISISLEKNVICLDIIDDGEGFDTSKNKKGIGLKNMTSRVEDINGKITFTSQSGDGTIVNVKIPYSNQST